MGLRRRPLARLGHHRLARAIPANHAFVPDAYCGRGARRIVTVASGISNPGKLEFDDLQSEQPLKPLLGSPSQSKLADLIFLLESQRRLTAAGSLILSTGAHPDYAITSPDQRPAGAVPISFRMVEMILKPLASQDAAHGVLPTLFAATSPP